MERLESYLAALRQVTQERWDVMAEHKRYFAAHPDSDPRTYPRMNPVIGASWLRSRQAGLVPGQAVEEQCLSPSELAAVLQREEALLQVAEEVFDPFGTLTSLAGCRLYLFDSAGVLLFSKGRAEEDPWFHGRIGKICTEATAGTCAHVLALRYGRPVQLLPVEQFSGVFGHMIGTAAPIRGEGDAVRAVVVLNQRMASAVLAENYREGCAHTLGLVASIADSIELQLRLVGTSQRLSRATAAQRQASEELAVMLDLLDEGILSVDREGNILHANRMGRQLAGAAGEDAPRDVRRLTDAPERLLAAIAAGERDTLEIGIGREGARQPCLAVVHPVRSGKEGASGAGGAILQIGPLERLNEQMSRRMGAVAHYSFRDIIGSSELMQRTLELGRRFARLPEAVLVCGESGTGKELLAQAIHNAYRPQGPFVALNCAALPRDLVESELFGYERGSFTGADKNGRPGKIELSHGGTLFLDEIGDMPLELQPVFLRVLENKEVTRIGGRQARKVDFRIIAATNRDLHRLQEQGQFRSDLYFRLSVLTLQLPPLRQRGEDICLLAHHFLEKYCRKAGLPRKRLAAEAERHLLACDWPGNVRQLENAIIYAANVAPGEDITPECLPAAVRRKAGEAAATVPDGKEEKQPPAAHALVTWADWEREAARDALARTGGNVTQAARRLGIAKATLYKKMRDYGIEADRK